MIKNTGLIWEKELADRSPEDWILGEANPSKLGRYNEKCVAEIPTKDRIFCIPEGEIQQSEKGDMCDCANRGPVNILEAKFNWLEGSDLLPPKQKAFLQQFKNAKGQIEISDAYVAIKAGNTPQGNSMIAPLDALRTCGIVPKRLMPLEKWMTWQDYHNPNLITPEIEAIAKESLTLFRFNYERMTTVNDVKTMLNRDIIDLCGWAWPLPEGGIYPRVDYEPNHVFMGLKNSEPDNLIYSCTDIFDNYLDQGVEDDFIKRLAADYKFWGQYRIILSYNFTNEEGKEIAIGLMQKLILIIQNFINEIQKKLGRIFGSKLYKTSFKEWSERSQ
jgi:hypothetical protein